MTRIFLILLITAYSFNSTFAQQFVEQSAVVGISHAFQSRGLMGGGAAFFDYDNDGDEDVYITGGLSKDHLYSNNGDGTFTKITTDIGLDPTLRYNTTGVTTGDIDNDGDRDIFVATWETFEGGSDQIARSLLFRNNGDGTFEEIGVLGGINQPAFSIGAMFFDYNKDGFLDLYVINHVETPAFLYDSTGVINGFDHECYPNFLYRNNGNRTFTEVAATMGLDDLSCTLAAMPSDFDMDGDLDIYLANDFGPFIIPNVLYQNNYPDNGFVDASAATGTGIAMYGMGIAAGDYDLDQDLDYYITNLGRNVLLENDNGVFTDATTTAGVENATVGADFATGWGTAFLDINNDTWVDLYVANGRIPSLSTLPTALNDPDKLYLNNGDKTFTDVTDADGINNIGYSRGMTCADFDQDGDLDILSVVIDELGNFSKFYVNQLDDDSHYIRFKLVGKESNRDAFGSKLWLYADGQTFLREIHGGGSSFCSQLSSIVHYGLGDIDQIDSLRIEWPNGHIDFLGPYAVDSLHVIEEGVITSTEEIHPKDEQELTISPNPFEAGITLQFQSVKEEDVLVQIFTLEGKLMAQRDLQLSAGQANLALDRNWPAGMYILNVKTDTHFFIRRLVKK